VSSSGSTGPWQPPAETGDEAPIDGASAQARYHKFYGYIGGEQSLFYPNLIDGTTFIGTPREPGYHFNTDLTSKAVAWIRATRSLTPDRPFLLYYAQSASHPPHTPPQDWLARDLYKGAFDDGWDVLRAKILARQITMGIVPPSTKLAENPPLQTGPRWRDLPNSFVREPFRV
jgi:arylsulfatase A-like enzyme